MLAGGIKRFANPVFGKAKRKLGGQLRVSQRGQPPSTEGNIGLEETFAGTRPKDWVALITTSVVPDDALANPGCGQLRLRGRDSSISFPSQGERKPLQWALTACAFSRGHIPEGVVDLVKTALCFPRAGDCLARHGRYRAMIRKAKAIGALRSA